MHTILFCAGMVFACFSLFVFAYHGAVIIYGILHKDVLRLARNKRQVNFCIIVCARNEAAVIGRLLESLKKADYPKNKLHIHVVADNCTDDTALTASLSGATVLERNDSTNVGKGYALSYFFGKTAAQNSEYDAFCIFDADNIVDPDFFNVMSRRINCGEQLIQGNRHSLNPSDTWVSGSYTLYFAFIMRLFCRARYKCGLSCLAGGTGFVFTPSLISDGWQTKTQTEDAEFSIQALLHKTPTCFAEDAVFYDEQPTLFRTSILQRRRWSSGTVQCLKIYGLQLVKAAFNGKSDRKTRFSCADFIMFMLSIPASAFSVIASLLMSIGLSAHQMPLFLAVELLAGYIAGVFFALIIALSARIRVKKLVRGILSFPIFCVSWSFISLSVLIHGKCAWHPIPRAERS